MSTTHGLPVSVTTGQCGTGWSLVDREGYVVATIGGAKYGAFLSAAGFSAEDTAKALACAVNAHDELVEVAKAVVAWADTEDTVTEHKRNMFKRLAAMLVATEKARAALAKIKELTP